MDPITDVAVNLKVQQALTAYRSRTDEDVLLATKATTTEVASLTARLDTTDALVVTKANAADVYTRSLTDQRISTAVSAASATASDASDALAQNLSTAVQTLSQNLANAQSTLTSQINAKVSTDAWPGLVLAAKAEVTSAASAAATVAASEVVASKAPLRAPSFTGPVLVDGQAVVLTNDARMSQRGPTGPAGAQGPTGPAGSGSSKAFFCAYAGFGQLLSTTFVTANFDTASLLTSSPGMSTTSGSYTTGFVAPAAGQYLISWSINARVSNWRAYAFVNGVQKDSAGLSTQGASSALSNTSVQTLAAGDIVTIQGRSNTGSDATWCDEGTFTVLQL